MEPTKRMITKEAFQDGNFGDGMFKGTAVADEELIDKADLSRGNRRSYMFFKNSVMIQFRKQYKDTKRSLDQFAINAMEGLDDIVGNTLNPSSTPNSPTLDDQGNIPNGHSLDLDNNNDQQDPDKIFRTYPSFDPVFMKV